MKKYKDEYHNLKNNLFVFNIKYHIDEYGLEVTDAIHIKSNKNIKDNFVFEMKLKIKNENFLDYIVDIEFINKLGEVKKEYDEFMKNILNFLGNEIHKDISSKLNLYANLDILEEVGLFTIDDDFNTLMKSIHDNSLIGSDLPHKIKKNLHVSYDA